MNRLEQTMVDILKRGRECYGYIGIKAEFEAEGTRVDELLRLIDIAHRADLKFAVKIGGCEAIRDLWEAKLYGVDYIIAPMIESPYALSKFIEAKDKCYSPLEKESVNFLFNIETHAALLEQNTLVLQAKEGKLAGVVFGRVDYVKSLGRSRDDINHEDITEIMVHTSELCRHHGLDLVVGGGVSKDSLPALRKLQSIHLTRFETRKVIFDAKALPQTDLEDGLIQAVEFELSWLKNKQCYYHTIAEEDSERIEMLERRWKQVAQPGRRCV